MTKFIGIQDLIEGQVEREREELLKWAREFVASFPLSPEQVYELFLYLEQHRLDCDHTFHYTTLFLLERGLDASKAIGWFHEYAGHCDCQLLQSTILFGPRARKWL